MLNSLLALSEEERGTWVVPIILGGLIVLFIFYIVATVLDANKSIERDKRGQDSKMTHNHYEE